MNAANLCFFLLCFTLPRQLSHSVPDISMELVIGRGWGEKEGDGEAVGEGEGEGEGSEEILNISQASFSVRIPASISS